MTLLELKDSLNNKFPGDFDKCHIMIKYLDSDNKENYDLVSATGYIEEPECVVLVGHKIVEKMIEEKRVNPADFE